MTPSISSERDIAPMAVKPPRTACYRNTSITTTRLLGDLYTTFQISWRYALAGRNTARSAGV